MKTFIRQDMWIVRFMGMVADLVTINLLTVITSIPLFTIGASVTAGYETMFDIIADSETSLIKAYFRAFKRNFKQSTMLWLAVLIIIVSLMCDYFLASQFLNGMAAKAVYGMICVLSLMLLCLLVYIFPLIAYFENKLIRHIKTAARLCVSRLPITLLLLVIELAPVVIAVLLPGLFMYLWIVWLMIGFTAAMLAACKIVLPIFKNAAGETQEET